MAAEKTPAPTPAAPASLGRDGKALWNAIVGEIDEGWDLDARERELLARACRCADELALLEAAVDRDGLTVAGSRGQVVVHPALAECRQLRLVQLRLLGGIEVVDPQTAGRSATSGQARGRRAAEARWGTHG